MVIIESEWDFGYGDTVFPSQDKAKEALKSDENVRELCAERNTDVDGLISEGLISFRQVLLG